MQYTTLGPTDIRIPRLCLGGMSFGEVFPDFHQWVIDQPATEAVIARALALGPWRGGADCGLLAPEPRG